MTDVEEAPSAYVLEMDLVGFIHVGLLDDLLERIDLDLESKAQLREWRYLSEKAFNEGHFEYALALAQALKCTAIYANQSLVAFPLARTKVRHKEARSASLDKVRSERHKAAKSWHSAAIKHHQTGKSGEWISRNVPGAPSKSAVNRFLKNNGALQVTSRADT